MKFFYCSLLGFLFSCTAVQAQVGIGTTNPNSKAKLEIVSTSQEVLFPHLNASQYSAARKIYKISGNVATLYAGSGSAVASDMSGPGALANDPSGNQYVVENCIRIKVITPSGTNYVLSGSITGQEADPLGGSFRFIRGMTAISNTLLVADTDNHGIKKITIL